VNQILSPAAPKPHLGKHTVSGQGHVLSLPLSSDGQSQLLSSDNGEEFSSLSAVTPKYLYAKLQQP